MGRNRKVGLDSFLMETSTFQDLRIRKLMKRHGAEAVTIYTMLLCTIAQRGYYTEYNDDLIFECSERLGIDEAKIADIITTCTELGLFSREMYDANSILTSYEIQKKYLRASQQARRVSKLTDYTLLDVAETPARQQRRPSSLQTATIAAQPTATANATSPQPPAAETPPPPLSPVESVNIIDPTPPPVYDGFGGHTITDDDVAALKQATTWKENICMNYAIRSGDKLDAYIDRFATHCKCSLHTHANLAQLQRHFYNWLRIERDNETKTETNGRHQDTEKTGRQGNLLQPEEKKDWDYSGTF